MFESNRSTKVAVRSVIRSTAASSSAYPVLRAGKHGTSIHATLARTESGRNRATVPAFHCAGIATMNSTRTRKDSS